MESTNDGFKLAQIDLDTRGSGEILGMRQAGESDLPAHILGDMRFVQRVRDAARRLMDTYPDLEAIP